MMPPSPAIGDRQRQATDPKAFFNRRTLAGGFAVTDDEVAQAIALAFTHLKLVVEPGGAVALAAVLSGKIAARDRATVVVCSGGNIDPGVFATALKRAELAKP